MQYDHNKQAYGNQYPPMNQPQYGPGNVYPPNNAPPAYAQYPHPPAAYPIPTTTYQHGAVIMPLYRPFWYNVMPTLITPGLRTFLIISGILFLVWGILGVGLEIGIIANSYRRFYLGFIGGGYLVGAGISMLVAACRPSYIMVHLIRMLSVALALCILGLILSIVNYTTSYRCGTYIYYSCDGEIAMQIKAVLIVLFIISTIHTIVSLVVTSNAHKRTLATPASSAPSYN